MKPILGDLWRKLIRKIRARRYARAFYGGYAFATKELYQGSRRIPSFVTLHHLQSLLDSAERYGTWDAFDDGVQAAMKDFEGRNPQGFEPQAQGELK